MATIGPRKVMPHEILRFVKPLQKGRSLDPAEAAACAKLILDLEHERRKLQVIVDGHNVAAKAHDQDWKVLLSIANKEITALKNGNKEMARQMKRMATSLVNAAEKYQLAAADDDSRRKMPKL